MNALPRKSAISHAAINTLAALLLWVGANCGVAMAQKASEPNDTLSRQEAPDAQFRQLLKKAIENSSAFGDRFDAEVWLVEMSGKLDKRAPHIPMDERMDVLRLVYEEAHHSQLDPQIVLSLIEVESNFDRYALSRVGAQGLMQVMPFWKKEIGHPDDNLFDIRTNLRYGCAILKLYLEMEKNDLTKALARYNGSRGQTWYPMRVYKALRLRWSA